MVCRPSNLLQVFLIFSTQVIAYIYKDFLGNHDLILHHHTIKVSFPNFCMPCEIPHHLTFNPPKPTRQFRKKINTLPSRACKKWAFLNISHSLRFEQTFHPLLVRCWDVTKAGYMCVYIFYEIFWHACCFITSMMAHRSCCYSIHTAGIYPSYVLARPILCAIIIYSRVFLWQSFWNIIYLVYRTINLSNKRT